MQPDTSNKRGIVIAVPRKYEKICLTNIRFIRQQNCMLPIEIWEVGKEISRYTRKKLSAIGNIIFCNVADYCENSRHWKGYQVKAFMIQHTSFDEFMLCDSDIIFHQNPELLFDDDNYIKTGTYFFKDVEKWQFSDLKNKRVQFFQKFRFDKFKSAVFFSERKKWIRSLLPERSPLFPVEWDYMYSDEMPDKPVKEALQESGVVVMNRKQHKDSLQNIYLLNNEHKTTYRYIWGDKETFWIGCVMADKPFYFNQQSGYISPKTRKLTHDYNGKAFFSQKG